MKKEYHLLQRKLAKKWLELNLQLEVVGVTGSYGKTTAVTAIAHVLSSRFSVNKTDINLDTIYNLPITILKTKTWNEVLVLEYGIDHLGEMDKHLSLVKPQIAVLTGITPVHTDKELLGSLENLIKEKTKLIQSLPEKGLAVFNLDDPYVKKIGREYKNRKVFYGLDKTADVWADKINITLDQTNFTLHDKEKMYSVKTKLLGYPAVYACLVSYAVGKEKTVDPEKIIKSLAELKPLSGRFSVEAGPRETILINDTKRANPVSTIAGLKSISLFPGRKIVVLGEMGELGDSSEEMHRLVGKQAADLKVDYTLCIGEQAFYIADEAKKNGLKNVFWVKDIFEAEKKLDKQLKKGDILYLKASLLRHLERLVLLLNGKKINCKVQACHRYRTCDSCPSLLK